MLKPESVRIILSRSRFLFFTFEFYFFCPICDDLFRYIPKDDRFRSVSAVDGRDQTADVYGGDYADFMGDGAGL